MPFIQLLEIVSMFQKVIWCLDSIFREIYTFALDFFTGPNAIEISSKLLKQPPVKI